MDVLTRQPREHGIASYNKKCRCDNCMEAGRERGRRARSRQRAARGRRPDDEMCLLCGEWFHPNGLGHHEARCRG